MSNDFQTGTYGWVVAAIHYGVAIPLLTGAGKCRTQDNIAIGNLDSTRMESIGLVAATRAIKSLQLSCTMTLVCDNSAAVDTYNDHRNMNMREWQRLENRDIWGYLDTFQTKKDRQNLEVQWHRGHPERRMEKSDYEPLDQTNVWADALATAAYSRNTKWCTPWELPTKIPQVVCYEGAVITSDVTTTIRKYIMRTAGEMYSENHKHIVDLTTIDRTELDRLENKLKSPTVKLAHVRRMWEIYPTNGYLNERDKRYHKTHEHHPGCHCGQQVESFTHMAYECKARRMTATRQLAICRFHDILDKHMPEMRQSKWAIFMLQLFNIEDDGTVDMWEQPTHIYNLHNKELPNWYVDWTKHREVTIDDQRSALSYVELGGRYLWKGLVPKKGKKIMESMKECDIEAESLWKAMRFFLLQFHRDIWAERCAIVHNKTSASKYTATELLMQARTIRNRMATYTQAASDEWLEEQTPQRLRTWIKHTTSALMAALPKRRTIGSYFPLKDDNNWRYLWQLRCKTQKKDQRSVNIAAKLSKSTRVSHRPLFVKELLCVTRTRRYNAREAQMRRQEKSVPPVEYDITLPGGMRETITKANLSRTPSIDNSDRPTSNPARKHKRKSPQIKCVATQRKTIKPKPNPAQNRNERSVAILFGQSTADVEQKLLQAAKNKRRMESNQRNEQANAKKRRERLASGLAATMSDMLRSMNDKHEACNEKKRQNSSRNSSYSKKKHRRGNSHSSVGSLANCEPQKKQIKVSNRDKKKTKLHVPSSTPTAVGTRPQPCTVPTAIVVAEPLTAHCAKGRGASLTELTMEGTTSGRNKPTHNVSNPEYTTPPIMEGCAEV